jgi:hypothetical protein
MLLGGITLSVIEKNVFFRELLNRAKDEARIVSKSMDSKSLQEIKARVLARRSNNSINKKQRMDRRNSKKK